MRNPGRFNGQAQVPEMSVSVNASPEAVTILVAFGLLAQQVTLSLDDAEGVANLILAKVKEGRQGVSPIVVVPGGVVKS